MLAILEPSIPAIEAATLLERPAEYLAKLRWSSREFRFERSAADKEAIAALRRDKSIPPPKRESLIGAVLRNSKTAQGAEWRRYREEAQQWVRIVRLYELDRNLMVKCAPSVRKAMMAKIERGVLRASGRQVYPSRDMTERRRREGERKACRQQAQRQRRQYGWRGRGDARTGWLTPNAAGAYDPAEVARAEWPTLTKSFSIDTGTEPAPVTKVSAKDMTDDERDDARIEALLRDEVSKFNRLRKKNGTAN